MKAKIVTGPTTPENHRKVKGHYFPVYHCTVCGLDYFLGQMASTDGADPGASGVCKQCLSF